METQRRYMDAWASLSKDATGSTGEQTGNGVDNPWNKALEYWWQSVAQTAPDGTRDIYSKLIEQTQSFYFITDQLSRFMQGLSEIGQQGDEWREQLDAHFEQMKKYMMHAQQAGSSAADSPFSAWQMPMDNLLRSMSSTSLFPGDFLQGFKPDGAQQAADKFLSVPGVGYTRESQEQLQEGMRLWLKYQNTANEYQSAMAQTGIKALDIMKERLLQMAAEEKAITKLREVYDLWVDCNEEAYAEFVYSEEYSRLYGRMVNDLMAVKKHGRTIMDESMNAMNMPTQKSMTTMQKRQQEMRREVISTRSRLAALEKQMQSLQGQSAKPSPAKPAPAVKSASNAGGKKADAAVTSKKTSRKKTSKKKS